MAKAKKKKKNPNKLPKEWKIPEARPLGKLLKTQDVLQSIVLEYLQRNFEKNNKFNDLSTEKKIAKVDAETSRILNRVISMYTEYDKGLNKLDSEKYVSFEQLDKEDRIDLTEMSNENISKQIRNKNINEYLKSLNVFAYAMMPCYKRGVYFIAEDEKIFFDVIDVDTENNSFTVFLRGYFSHAKNGWDYGCGCIVKFKGFTMSENIEAYMKNNTILDDFKITQEESFPELYTRISPKTLGWDKESCNIWQGIVLQNAVDIDALIKALNKLSYVQELVATYRKATLVTNYLLSKNRPTIIRETKDHNLSSRLLETKPIDVDKPRVRTLGLVKFVSPKPPARVNEKVARSYILTEWNVKGFIRHYKSGKIVYIKPTVHKRQKDLIQNTSGKTEPKQRITKVRNNLERSEQNG